MIKAVVFDLDDTLISEKEYVLSGFKVVSKEIAKQYKLDNKEVLKKMNELFNESSKNVFNRVLDFYNIQYWNNEILYLINIYRNHEPDINFFDDVIPTIKELKKNGIKIGMITDGYKETQLRKIEALKCRELFDEIIITDELGREFWKPNEKSYLIMAERLGIKLNEMVYVGDNEEKDFIGANKLGIYTSCIKRKNGIYNKSMLEKEYIAKNNINVLNKIKEYIYWK